LDRTAAKARLRSHIGQTAVAASVSVVVALVSATAAEAAATTTTGTGAAQPSTPSIPTMTTPSFPASQGPSRPGSTIVDPAAVDASQAATTAAAAAREAKGEFPLLRRAKTSRTRSHFRDKTLVGNNHDYVILDGNEAADLNAQACGVYANIIVYSGGSNCNTGVDNIWDPVLLANGYVLLRANYNNNYECAIQNGTNSAPTSVYPCNETSGFPVSYEYRQPNNTPAPCNSSFNYIVPSTNYGLSFNVKGGFGNRNPVVDYSQNGCPSNDLWLFEG
jgi:hypothetical protein